MVSNDVNVERNGKDFVPDQKAKWLAEASADPDIVRLLALRTASTK